MLRYQRWFHLPTFKRQVCLVVLLFIKQFLRTASALRVCLSGIKYWFSITPHRPGAALPLRPFYPLSPFFRGNFYRGFFFGCRYITLRNSADALMTIYWSSLTLVFLPGLRTLPIRYYHLTAKRKLHWSVFCLFWIAMKQSQARYLHVTLAYKPCSEIRSAAAVFWVCLLAEFAVVPLPVHYQQPIQLKCQNCCDHRSHN